MGFDVRGNVKVFDFGLAKSLVSELSEGFCSGTAFHFTKCGSLPYMAPEVALNQPYNEKCDVYSYCLVLYEMMTLKAPFSSSISKNFHRRVLVGGVRPRMPRGVTVIPRSTKQALKMGWSACHQDRPDMSTISSWIQQDVDCLSASNLVSLRADQILNISMHSSVNTLNESRTTVQFTE